ncbi:MAG TPA: serine hydrolase [Streptosporangiaceae bacterium]|nr:serine hydrolase [Streptosporangiaceae bacterium]
MPVSRSSWAARLLRLALAGVSAAAIAGLPGAAAAARQGDAADAAGPGGPLDGVLAYLRSREGAVQVALFNKADGRTYLVSDGSATQYTASIVKADIAALWLWRYQSRPGTIPANLPFSIRYLMQNMITMSDNSAATGLFYFSGGCTTLTLFNTLIPTRHTKVGCETPTYYGWGNTTTTAADQVAVIATFAYPNRTLAADAREFGLHLMESVIPSQRWGVSCGPWGTVCEPPDYAHPVPGVTVALKNGWKFVPTCTQQDETCPWQVNSIGWVQGKGRDYVLAVLATDNPAGPGTFGFDYGITTIQGVSQRIWGNLAPRSP